jgi:hypothetical protein
MRGFLMDINLFHNQCRAEINEKDPSKDQVEEEG